MRYPELSYYKAFSNREIQDMYDTILRWSSELTRELDSRDVESTFQGIKYVVTETTVADYRKALGGSVVYATSSGKYYGWNAVTSAWDAFN